MNLESNLFSGARLWFFGHHVFSVDDDRTCISCCRANGIDNKEHPVVKKDGEVLLIGEVVTDCVFDSEHKLLFVLCRSGRVCVHRYDLSLLKWTLIEELVLSSQCCKLVGSACCLNGHIYWQTLMESGLHKVSIISSQYHVKTGCEADGVMNVSFSPPVQILNGCLPADLIPFRSDVVLALPRCERTRGIIITISPVRVIISDILCGIIGCHNHLLAPVEFSSICLSILSALQSPERSKMLVRSVVCDGQQLMMVCSSGSIWTWDPVEDTFSKSNFNIPAELLNHRIIICAGSLVFINQGGQFAGCMNLGSGSRSDEGLDLGTAVVLSWCYGGGDSPKEVLICCSDGRVISLNQILFAKNVNQTMEKSSHDLTSGPLSDPPVCVTELKAKLASIVEQRTPKGSHSSQLLQLLDTGGGGDVLETDFSRELSQKLDEGGLRIDISMFNASPVVTVEVVLKLLDTVSSAHLDRQIATLAHYADVARKTCLTAFIQYLLEVDNESEGCRRWTKFLTLNCQKTGGGGPPLVLMFLYLIWQLQPHCIVDSVLMVGCKYKDCLSVSSAPTLIVDSLLDMIDLQLVSDTKVSNSYLLLYYQLLVLCSSEFRVIEVISRMRDNGKKSSLANDFLGGATDIHKHLLEQYINSNTTHQLTRPLGAASQDLQDAL